MAKKMDFGKMTVNKVDENEGFPVIHTRVDVPIPFVKERSMFIQPYYVPTESVFFTSSKALAEFETKHKKAVAKKDVIGTLEVNYWHFKPTEDGNGSHITHVTCSNPNGSIPDMAVSKMT